MEVSSDSDSDSSVDSVEKTRLLEAAVCADILTRSETKTETTDTSHSHVRINNHKPGRGLPASKPERQLLSNKKSLRPTESNHFDDDNGLNTTPEAKDFIAKKLSQYLDKNIEGDKEFEVKQGNSGEDAGIRLFVKSSNLIKSDGCDVMSERVVQRQRKRQISSSSDSSDENERLAEAAVSHDFIIQQSRLSLPGSNPSQQDSLNNSDGDVINKHNGDMNNFNTGNKNTDDVKDVGEKSHKKKKKKKKHKHSIEIKVS